MQNNITYVFAMEDKVALLHKNSVIDRGVVVGRTRDKPEDTRYDIATKEKVLLNVAPGNMRRL